jgi:alpha-tubulin suppressor-like RCC1 family protein
MSLLIDVPVKYNGYNKNGFINAGFTYSFFINKFGKSFGWGYNSAVNLGDNTNIAKVSPVLIALYGLNKTFCQISGGTNHSLAIDKNGRAWGWGSAGQGRIGDNSTTAKCYPVLVAGTIKTFCQISAGSNQSVAIDKNGRAWAWGLNGTGQLGDNSTVSKLTPVSVLGAVKTFCQITSGDTHSVTIDKNGRAWAWGGNNVGQLGDNSIVSKLTPVSVLGAVKTFCQISTGNSSSFSLAIDKNGRVWAWGFNNQGQLGDNSIGSKRTPVSVLGAVKTFCKISTGQNHSLAIDKNGRAWAWGANGSGRLGDNSIANRLTPVSVQGAVKTFCQIDAGGTHSVAIDKNGRVWAWGVNSSAEIGNNLAASKRTPVSVLGAVKTFCQITTANAYSIAIDKNGRAWGWGYNSSGQLGDNSIANRLTPVSVQGAVKTFCQIDAGGQGNVAEFNHSLAIDKNGRVWAWGYNASGQLGDNSIVSKRTPVSVLGAVKTFCKISGGQSHSLAIDKNGRAWAWGGNASGRLGDNSIVSKLTPVSVLGAVKTFCEITAGNAYSIAIDKNGRAWGWGYNLSGQLGDNSITSKLTPVSVQGAVKTFCKISGGQNHSLTIDKNGRAWAWGQNTSGQLGLGGIISVFTPVTITGATKTFCAISAGDGFSTAIDKNGRAWAWGANNGGQLGDNSIVQKTSPVSVLGTVRTFCKITGGGVVNSSSFTLALDKNGRAWSWGYNGVGQLGNNAVTSQLTPVSILGAVKTFCQISNGVNQPFALAIDKNGRAWAWGVNGNGQLGNNTVISQRTPVSVLGAIKTFCKVSVGGFHSLAIDKNGRLWAWGNNSNGQLGNNTSANSALTPVSVLGAVKTFCHIAGGNSQSVAIDKNGQAWGWGFNGSGQTGDGSATDRLTPVSVQGQKKTFCKIASGNGTTLSIDNYGRLWAWGFNGNAQVGDGSTIPKRTPTRVCNTRTFCEVTGANTHVLAIEKNGQVWAWGTNTSGQLANNYIASVLTPVSVAGAVKTFCQISGGSSHSAALDKNGKIWTWGRNDVGQLGIGSTRDYFNTPVSIYGNKTFCKIQVSVTNSAAIDYQGKVWSWGLNTSNQLGTNNYITSILTPVRVCVI